MVAGADFTGPVRDPRRLGDARLRAGGGAGRDRAAASSTRRPRRGDRGGRPPARGPGPDRATGRAAARQAGPVAVGRGERSPTAWPTPTCGGSWPTSATSPTRSAPRTRCDSPGPCTRRWWRPPTRASWWRGRTARRGTPTRRWPACWGCRPSSCTAPTRWRCWAGGRRRPRPRAGRVAAAGREEVVYGHPDGFDRILEVTRSPLSREATDGLGSLLMVTDVTESATLGAGAAPPRALRPADGLPNRYLVLDRLEMAAARQARWSAVPGPGGAPRCSSSTSTASSRSTTSTATRPATSCSARSRRGWPGRCGPPTRSVGTAATSS